MGWYFLAGLVSGFLLGGVYAAWRFASLVKLGVLVPEDPEEDDEEGD